jgi:predicted RNA-binding Zn-ribbon protein involved in translation (DUF1610 family)
MIDIFPVDERKIKDPVVTKDFSCQACGGTVCNRSWDAEHQTFCYHCLDCGYDSKVTLQTYVLGWRLGSLDLAIAPIWKTGKFIDVNGQSLSGNDGDIVD